MPAKIEIGFGPMEEQLRRISEAGNSPAVKSTVSQTLEATQAEINRDLKKAMEAHHRDHAGKHTVDTLMRTDATWDGDTCSIDIGFDINNGGLASIFLMYGTKPHGPRGTSERTIRDGGGNGHPGTQPDAHLKNAIFGAAVKKRILERQEKALAELSAEILGG